MKIFVSSSDFRQKIISRTRKLVLKTVLDTFFVPFYCTKNTRTDVLIKYFFIPISLDSFWGFGENEDKKTMPNLKFSSSALPFSITTLWFQSVLRNFFVKRLRTGGTGGIQFVQLLRTARTHLSIKNIGTYHSCFTTTRGKSSVNVS